MNLFTIFGFKGFRGRGKREEGGNIIVVLTERTTKVTQPTYIGRIPRYTRRLPHDGLYLTRLGRYMHGKLGCG